MNVYAIDGYWTDDQSEFSNYLVCDFDCTPASYSDEQIFWYGLSENNIKQAIKTGEAIDDFVITDYQLYEEDV